MTTPVDETPEPSYGPPPSLPSYNVNNPSRPETSNLERSSDEEGTVVGEGNGSFHAENEKEGMPQETQQEMPQRQRQHSHLAVDTDYEHDGAFRSMQSPSQTREQAFRLDDDLAFLKIERQVSQLAEEKADLADAQSMGRSRSRRDDTVDEFDVATNPIHEQAAVYKPPAHPVGNFSKLVKKIHQSSFLVRYLTYITPVVLILLIPLLIGALVSPAQSATVGGVYLLWFMIWLEIVWLTLWAGRVSFSHPSMTTRY